MALIFIHKGQVLPKDIAFFRIFLCIEQESALKSGAFLYGPSQRGSNCSHTHQRGRLSKNMLVRHRRISLKKPGIFYTVPPSMGQTGAIAIKELHFLKICVGDAAESA